MRDFSSVMAKLNKVLIDEHLSAREVVHVAKEMELNGTISLIFAQLIKNAKTEETEKDKGPGKP